MSGAGVARRAGGTVGRWRRTHQTRLGQSAAALRVTPSTGPATIADVTVDRNDRRAQVLTVVRASRIPLDDDEIALRAQMNRHYVNAICRQLAAEQLITRERGAGGKLVNAAADLGQPIASVAAGTPRAVPAQPSRDQVQKPRTC